MRPILKPALRRLWRDATTLQLGLTPAHAVVLTGLTEPDRRVLALLDGTRDVAAIGAAAAEKGVPRQTAERIVSALGAARVLDDAAAPTPRVGEDDRQRLEPDFLSLSLRHPLPGAAGEMLRRRQRSVVAVHGLGRVGSSVALLLAAAGVGTLACVDPAPLRAADLTPSGVARMRASSRGKATARRIHALSSAVRAGTDRPTPVTLSVLAPASPGALPELVAGARAEPHLLVHVTETTGVVGPLVVPGRSPCLRCVALSRGDRDPLWPAIAAQLAGATSMTEACDVTLATLVSALAAMQVLAFLDGDPVPASVAGTIEYDLATGSLRRRSVQAHPGCGCGADSTGRLR